MVIFVSILFVIIILQQIEIIFLYKTLSGFFDGLIIRIMQKTPQKSDDHSETE